MTKEINGSSKVLKFRAWDKNLERWVIAELTPFGLLIDIEFKAGEINLTPRVSTIPEPRHYNLKNWMQFTGLLDKNGKEIYEGDIVTGVTWDDTGDVIHWQEDEQGWRPYINRHCEIIGNIYENPEPL